MATLKSKQLDVFKETIKTKAVEYLMAVVNDQDDKVRAHYDSIYEIGVLAKEALEQEEDTEEQK